MLPLMETTGGQFDDFDFLALVWNNESGSGCVAVVVCCTICVCVASRREILGSPDTIPSTLVVTALVDPVEGGGELLLRRHCGTKI